MARARTAKHPAPAPPPEPEDESQEEPEEEETPSNGQPAIKKADAVRAALAEGLDSPGDIVDFIKKRFNIDMPKQMASSYKAQQRARDVKAEGGEPSGRGRPRSTASPQPTGIPQGFTADVAQLRGLIAKAGGVEALKEMLTGPLPTLASKYGNSGLIELLDAIA